MITYNNLYEKVCSMDNLKLASKKAKKGKSQMSYVKEFEANLYENLLKLKGELEALTYEPRPLRVFVIRDPKTRLISAPHFRDRVVHHALCNVIEPIFERAFIHDSYASRKGKGTHAALRRFDEFKRKVSRNGRLVTGRLRGRTAATKDSNMVIGYVLKADIRHYFASVDHGALLRIIGRKIRDDKAMRLVSTILSSYAPSGKGMPIGALTSQLFANIYLNELDYFVKHRLRAEFYIRYMDDFVLLHESAEQLHEWRYDIGRFLKTALLLELHPEKTKVFPLHAGVCILGYRVFYRHKLLKESNIRLMKARIGNMAAQSLEGWMAYASYADSYNLIMRLNPTLLRPLRRPSGRR